jgi:hypothetical protein
MAISDWLALSVLIVGVVALSIEWYRSFREARGHHNGRFRFGFLLAGILALLVQFATEHVRKYDQERILAELQATRLDQEQLLAALKITRREQVEHRREQDRLFAAVNSLEAKGLLTREEARAVIRPAPPTWIGVSDAPPPMPSPPLTDVPVRAVETASAPLTPSPPVNLTVR